VTRWIKLNPTYIGFKFFIKIAIFCKYALGDLLKKLIPCSNKITTAKDITLCARTEVCKNLCINV